MTSALESTRQVARLETAVTVQAKIDHQAVDPAEFAHLRAIEFVQADNRIRPVASVEWSNVAVSVRAIVTGRRASFGHSWLQPAAFRFIRTAVRLGSEAVLRRPIRSLRSQRRTRREASACECEPGELSLQPASGGRGDDANSNSSTPMVVGGWSASAQVATRASAVQASEQPTPRLTCLGLGPSALARFVPE